MMRTRREQVQAYRFVTRRIVSALLSGEPETNNLPMRRLGMALFGSVMVGAIVLAVVGAYGLLTNNRASLDADTLIIERETGAKYVYLGDPPQLYPVLNYASARLILNKPDPTIRTMSQGSLKGYPRGLPVGIPNAPDALPEPSALLGLPWHICETPGAEGSESQSQLLIGRPLTGGVAPGDQALLVSEDNSRYLLLNDTRFQVNGDSTLVGLGLSEDRAVPVGEPLLNALQAGPDVLRLNVPRAGKRSTRQLGVEKAFIGDIFRVSGQYYVLLESGLAPVGEVTTQLRVAAGREPKDITAQDAARNLSTEKFEPEGFPQHIPVLHPGLSPKSVICATYQDHSPRPTLSLLAQTPPVFQSSSGEGVDAPKGENESVETVDRIIVEGGRGALVQALSPAEEGPTPGATVYLVTEQGMKYPLGTASGDALSALGYGAVTPTAVPASLLALIPTGPTLDAQSAQSFVQAEAEKGSGTPDRQPSPPKTSPTQSVAPAEGSSRSPSASPSRPTSTSSAP